MSRRTTWEELKRRRGYQDAQEHGMDLIEAMRTTYAVREFTDEPVADEAVYRILDSARFAPSGGNRQGWRVVVIRDGETKARLAELVEPAMKRYMAQRAAGEFPWNPLRPPGPDAQAIEQARVPGAMLDQLRKAPVLLAICLDLNVVAAMDQELDRVGVISGASIYPFVWNVLMAARTEGLGGNLTTGVAAQEPAARELLGLPEDVAIAALVPLGHPAQRPTKLRRKPVEEFAVHERWGGEPLQP